MSQRQPSRRFSWKKPWGFDNYHDMRKYITEREVYKKIGLLERHSSYKKPYWNFEAHPHGELRYSWPGFPPHNRPPGPGFPNALGPAYGDCAMACLGGILDCENGGCDNITCICGDPPYSVRILEDPTGRAWVEGAIQGTGPGLEGTQDVLRTSSQAPGFPRVCIPENTELGEEDPYQTIIAVITDVKGEQDVVEFPLVNCLGCCDEFTITPQQSTINPGAEAYFTISPPCPGATGVTTSNSNCTMDNPSVNASGTTASVTVGDSDCGSFSISLVDAKSGCTEAANSGAVRINNVIQSNQATWQQVFQCILLPAETCGVSGFGCRDLPVTNGNCIIEEFKYIYSYECCYDDLFPGAGCGTDCGTCPAQLCGPTPCTPAAGICGDPNNCSCFGTSPHWIENTQQEWKCACDL